MVKTKDRWSALSMKDRADLIKLYVSNGITSLDIIKKDYNSFGDGGDTEGDDNNDSTTPERKLTLEEFLQAKADSTRVAAHAKSLSRDEGVEIIYPLSEGRKEANQQFVDQYYDLNPEFIGPTLPSHLGIKPSYDQAVKELNNNCEYGLNCIGTATDNYPEDSREVSNESFRGNYEEKGFYIVPFEEKLPGDIVQQGGHSVIFDSYKRDPHPTLPQAFGDAYPVYNYSNGSIGTEAYRKQKRYPFTEPVVYRYIGTPTLIQQWTEEYNAQNKKLGGKINRFDTGGPTREMTPAEAAALNKTLNNSQYMLAVGDSPDDPAYLSTDILEPAAVKAFNSNEDYNRYYGEQFGKQVAEGMNNAAPYVLEAAMLPFTISGAVETPMLLYQGAKALPQAVKLGKSVFRKGKKYFGKKVLGMVDDMNGYVKEGSHFRIVDKPAIDDAITSGTIRSKTGLYHGTPEYLQANFSKYLDDIPGWEQMDALELRKLLESKGAFEGMSDAAKFEAKLMIRNSTNHGGTVGYFKDTPYPNYHISNSNYVIETPEYIGSFVPGHGGKEFVDYRGPVGASLLKTNGSVKGASIPSKGSSYWEYSPFWEMWKSNKFDDGGNTEDRGKLRSLLEHIAELGTFVPATPMGVYLNTISRRGKKTSEPKDTEDTAVETSAYEHKDWMDSYSREDFEDYVNSPERKFKWVLQGFNGWSKEDLDYLYSRLGDAGWDPKALAYAISGETNFRPYVGNSASSAIGLAQLTKAQMETLFGKDNWQNVYNSYVDKTRPVRDIIDDTIKQYKWMHNRIKTEPDSMGYGRLKINLLAPNSGLDSKISDIIFKNSLTDSQKDKLAQGDSTYRDLMKMYDDEFNEHFTK